MAIATTSSVTGLLVPLEKEGFVEPPELDPVLLKQVVTEDDATTIHVWLKDVAVDWYTVGFHLKVPKSELDKIRCDYHFTSEQLIAMIHSSINGCGITWEDLTEALKNCGHGNIVRLVLNKVNESFMKEFKQRMNFQIGDQRIRELKEKSNVQKNMCTRKENLYKLRMGELRQLLSIPTCVSEAFCFENMEFYINLSTVLHGFYVFSCHIKELAMSLHEYHLSLEFKARADLQLKNEFKQRIVEKQELIYENNSRENIESLNLGQMRTEERNEAIVAQASRTLTTKHLSQSLEEHRNELHTCSEMMTSCQTHIDEAVNKSNALSQAINSIKNSCSIYYTLLMLISIIVLCAMQKFTWYTILITQAFWILITGFSVQLMSRSNAVPLRLKVRVYRLLFQGLLKKFLICILLAMIASAVVLSSKHSTYIISESRLSETMYDLTFTLPGVVMGWKLFSTLLFVSHHGIKCANVFMMYLFCCVIGMTMACFQYFHKYLLIGFVIGLILNSIQLSTGLQHAMSVCLGLYLCFLLLLFGMFIGQMPGLDRFTEIVGGAIGSVVVTVLYKAFNTVTGFPTAIVEEKMEESIRLLDEDIRKLKVTRNEIDEQK